MKIPDWAVLVYSSASPDLEPSARAALDELARAAQPDSVVLGAQLGTREGAARYVMTGAVSDEMSRPPAETLACDMSQPASLEDFLRWGMRRFPARQYLVVLGGHGGGFLGAVGNPERSRLMRPAEMAAAIGASGLKPQVLALNACLMAQAEVAAELAPHSDFLVAAQGLEHAEGMPLGALIERLPGLSAEGAARALVEESSRTPERTPSMSAVSSAALGQVAAALDALGGAMLAAPSVHEQVRGILRGLPDYRERPGDRPLTDYKDLREFARRLEGTALAPEAKALGAALDTAVVASFARADHPAAHGLSAYMPSEPLQAPAWVEELYRSTALARGTRWDDALDVLV